MVGEMVLTLLGGLWLLTLHISGSGSFPRPLTAKQERECLERMRRGDRTARNELVEHNLRLVAHIVKKYYAISGEQDDLISIGTIGLIKAVESYDLGKKTKFSTYASRCIENAILSKRKKRRLRWRNRRLLRQNGACWREWESTAIFCFPMYQVR